MKLKINGEYAEVEFWSFMKCNFISNITLTAIIYGGLTIIV